MTCETCGAAKAVRRFCSKRCKAIAMKPSTLVHSRPHTSDTKLKLRLASLGNTSRRGHVASAETLDKMRAASLGARSSLWIDGRSGDVDYQRFRNRQKAHRRRVVVGSHTKQDWEALKVLYGFRCACCRTPETASPLTEDHIAPVVNGGTNWIWNIQPLCQGCNSRKQTATIHYEVPA